MCLMNMFLHNIGEIDGGVLISPNDALVAPSGQTYDYVLANPPFGKKSSMSFTNEEGEQEKDDLTYNRQDFWATTSNKQLNRARQSILKWAFEGKLVDQDPSDEPAAGLLEHIQADREEATAKRTRSPQRKSRRRMTK